METDGLLPRKKLEAKIALALYFSARANNQPKCMDEIIHYCKANSSEVNSCLKKTESIIFSNFDMRQHAEDLADRVTWKLGLEYNARQYVRTEVLTLKEYMEGKPPKTIVAVGLLYWVVQLKRVPCGETKVDLVNRIYGACGITKATLFNNAR